MPEFWSQADDGAGRTVLTYAVRGGKAAFALTALGGACLVAGVWGALWLLIGGEPTIGGVIFVLLVPGGLAAFGAHCLDITWRARTEYAFGRQAVVARRISLWGSKSEEFARADAVSLSQHYSPPDSRNAAGHPGTWATILTFRRKGAERDLVFDGMGSPEEARWLGPWVARWAGIAPKRGFGDADGEADPGELPNLDE